MKKFVVAIAVCAALAACKKEDAAPADAAAPATKDAAATAAAPAQSSMPKECEDYMNRVKACIGKSSGNAAAGQFQSALDQSRAQWEAVPDKSTLIPACKQANEQFAQTAKMLKCE